jgi:hypothetical protein
MSNGKPPKKRKQPGAGMSGGTSRMSRAEETVLAKGVEGKTDISTQPKYIKALSAEHARTGEKKSSYTQRTKRKPKVATLDTSTGKRTSEKRKLTPQQKAKAKRAAHHATTGRTRAEKKKYKQR